MKDNRHQALQSALVIPVDRPQVTGMGFLTDLIENLLAERTGQNAEEPLGFAGWRDAVRNTIARPVQAIDLIGLDP